MHWEHWPSPSLQWIQSMDSIDCCCWCYFCRSARHDNVRRTVFPFPIFLANHRPLSIYQCDWTARQVKLLFKIDILQFISHGNLQMAIVQFSERVFAALKSRLQMKVTTDVIVMEWVIIEFSQIYLLQSRYISTRVCVYVHTRKTSISTSFL